jgi:hypothetical protein
VTFLCSGKVGHVQNIRAEDILLEAEKKNVYSISQRGTRLTDQRRRQINEIDAVEERMNRSRLKPPVTDPGIRPS